MRLKSLAGAAALLVTCCAVSVRFTAAGASADSWPTYGHDPGNTRYSPLTDITRENVAHLSVAWTYHTGDTSSGKEGVQRSGLETTPIVVDGMMFLTTGRNRIIALNPETGQERWTFDPHISLAASYGDGLINRGVATWLDASARDRQPCRRRIYEATLDARLVAVDAATGRACDDFGARGIVSLTDVDRYRAGWYHMTSPPLVIDDVVVVGSAIDDNTRVDMPSGAVRGFDARTGALKWTWEPIQKPNVAPGKVHPWTTGAGNAWSVMAADVVNHRVLLPTGSASPDYFGGLRPGDDKWANSIVALDSRTGKLAWGYQLVHHDLWDYDSAAPPVVAFIRRAGQQSPVVVQGNKTGLLYLLNLRSGEPAVPIPETIVPASDVPGETAYTTQPVPALPPAVSAQKMSSSDAWGPTVGDRDACRIMLEKLRADGLFTPPSLRGTLVYPGNIGGINWSGYAFDVVHGLLIVNSNNLPAEVRLIPREQFDDPKFVREDGEYGIQQGAPYVMFRRYLLSPSGLPCVAPPWGMLTAVDLQSLSIRWQVPLGSLQELVGDRGTAPPGSISLGGPIVTAGGLIFQAGTLDRKLRAFDVETGEELWAGALPASGHATPMTYKLTPQGKQYVVVAAGGHAKLDQERQDDAIVAFALN